MPLRGIPRRKQRIWLGTSCLGRAFDQQKLTAMYPNAAHYPPAGNTMYAESTNQYVEPNTHQLTVRLSGLNLNQNQPLADVRQRCKLSLRAQPGEKRNGGKASSELPHRQGRCEQFVQEVQYSNEYGRQGSNTSTHSAPAMHDHQYSNDYGRPVPEPFAENVFTRPLPARTFSHPMSDREEKMRQAAANAHADKLACMVPKASNSAKPLTVSYKIYEFSQGKSKENKQHYIDLYKSGVVNELMSAEECLHLKNGVERLNSTLAFSLSKDTLCAALLNLATELNGAAEAARIRFVVERKKKLLSFSEKIHISVLVTRTDPWTPPRTKFSQLPQELEARVSGPVDSNPPPAPTNFDTRYSAYSSSSAESAVTVSPKKSESWGGLTLRKSQSTGFAIGAGAPTRGMSYDEFTFSPPTARASVKGDRRGPVVIDSQRPFFGQRRPVMEYAARYVVADNANVEQCSFFHELPPLSHGERRQLLETMFDGKVNGQWLLRFSDGKGGYIISVKYMNKLLHVPIQMDTQGKFSLNTIGFDTITGLLNFYSANDISDTIRTPLTDPVEAPEETDTYGYVVFRPGQAGPVQAIAL